MPSIDIDKLKKEGKLELEQPIPYVTDKKKTVQKKGNLFVVIVLLLTFFLLGVGLYGIWLDTCIEMLFKTWSCQFLP